MSGNRSLIAMFVNKIPQSPTFHQSLICWSKRHINMRSAILICSTENNIFPRDPALRVKHKNGFIPPLIYLNVMTEHIIVKSFRIINSSTRRSTKHTPRFVSSKGSLINFTTDGWPTQGTNLGTDGWSAPVCPMFPAVNHTNDRSFEWRAFGNPKNWIRRGFPA
jgi:hypothetical protein